MKAVLLAGGMGTRLQEETRLRPKPMVEIGGMPILWHIMKHFHQHEISEFVVACGYMGDFIKGYFLDQYHLSGNLLIDFSKRDVQREHIQRESWSVNLIDTGLMTNTGGRLRRLKDYVGDDTFMLTYGDGVCNVDLRELLAFHRQQGRIATLTAVRPPARFGGLTIEDGNVSKFSEKPRTGEGWINGGFMVLEPAIFDCLHDDAESLESHALEQVADDGQLSAYCHEGFWQCMDTLKQKELLEAMWHEGSPPWRTWQQHATQHGLKITPARDAA